MAEKYLVTSALPYANGPLHLGHIAGAYLPADIFVRYCRMKKRDVIYICGTDEHGVPITITADKEGVTPFEVATRYHKIIYDDFIKLGMSFDNFSRTSLPIHHELSQKFFLRLLENGYIKKATMQQLYCPKCQRFLPDRYIEGTCPYCNSAEARGDQCEQCGKWLDPMEIISPHCKICNSIPEIKETEHWFLLLPKFAQKLSSWLENKKYWRDNVRNYSLNLIKEGALVERAITRDLDWGVKVPLAEAGNKVLYVWFDAPIGYISSTIEWAQKIGEPERWKEYWLNPECKLIHFIGKDNIVFHTIVWPSMLMGYGEYILPENVVANEFLNFEERKFSTSRGWAVWLGAFLSDFSPDLLRYYLTYNAPETTDVNFSWTDFQSRTNSDLSDTLGNLVNRSLKFIEKYFNNQVPPLNSLSETDLAILETIEKTPQKVGEWLDKFKFKFALKELLSLVHRANGYLNDKKPWETRKENPKDCETTLNICAQLIRTVAILSSPFMPETSEKIWNMLNLEGQAKCEEWDEAGKPVIASGHRLGKLKILFPKIEDEKIQFQLDKLKILGEGKEE